MHVLKCFPRKLLRERQSTVFQESAYSQKHEFGVLNYFDPTSALCSVGPTANVMAPGWQPQHSRASDRSSSWGMFHTKINPINLCELKSYCALPWPKTPFILFYFDTHSIRNKVLSFCCRSSEQLQDRCDERVSSRCSPKNKHVQHLP